MTSYKNKPKKTYASNLTDTTNRLLQFERCTNVTSIASAAGLIKHLKKMIDPLARDLIAFPVERPRKRTDSLSVPSQSIPLREPIPATIPLINPYLTFYVLLIPESN